MVEYIVKQLSATSNCRKKDIRGIDRYELAFADLLNEMANEGWRVVKILNQEKSTWFESVVVVFERNKNNTE